MTINFLEPACVEKSRIELQFGLCDDQNGKKAYSDISNCSNWIATVKNGSAKEVQFVAIDNCIVIFKSGKKEKESTCDGMLVFENGLFFG